MVKEAKEKTKNVKKNKKVKKVKKNENFFKGVKKELKLVKWPTIKEIIKYSIATVVFCIILIFFFELIKFGMAYVRGVLN